MSSARCVFLRGTPEATTLSRPLRRDWLLSREPHRLCLAQGEASKIEEGASHFWGGWGGPG